MLLALNVFIMNGLKRLVNGGLPGNSGNHGHIYHEGCMRKIVENVLYKVSSLLKGSGYATTNG